MNPILLVITALVAALDWLAVWKQWRRMGYFAKPLTIILLFTWLVVETRLQASSLWFGIGLLFSLAGDVFLIFPPRFFLFGLGAFALTHLAYLVGFMLPLPTGGFHIPAGLALGIGLLASVVMRRITNSQISRGLKKLVNPTRFYAILISLMLLSTLWTLFRPDWTFWNALLVSLGAILFYTSDLVNAWIRFVNPVRSGRVLVMVTYHLGQFMLIVGMVLNFRPW